MPLLLLQATAMARFASAVAAWLRPVGEVQLFDEVQLRGFANHAPTTMKHGILAHDTMVLPCVTSITVWFGRRQSNDEWHRNAHKIELVSKVLVEHARQ